MAVNNKLNLLLGVNSTSLTTAGDYSAATGALPLIEVLLAWSQTHKLMKKLVCKCSDRNKRFDGAENTHKRCVWTVLTHHFF